MESLSLTSQQTTKPRQKEKKEQKEQRENQQMSLQKRNRKHAGQRRIGRYTEPPDSSQKSKEEMNPLLK